MLIEDIPRRTAHEGRYVDVPVYHRTHLGLSQDTTVHYCVLPGNPVRAPGGSVRYVPELVVAPFDFESWDRIWRITTTLRDRPGLLDDLCQTMADHGVNIIASESGLMAELGMYHVEMVVHLTEERTLGQVEWTILSRLFDDLEFLEDGSPRLRIRRVHNLWRVKRTFDELTLACQREPGMLPFAPFRSHAKVEPLPAGRDRLRGVRLRLPREVRDILAATVRDGGDWGYHLRMSDTKDRFLRVLFFSCTDTVIHVRIEHEDRIGALALITRALRRHRFSLISCLTTPAEGKHRATTECVVRATDVECAPTAVIKSRLEEALASSDASRELALQAGYPQGYARPWEKRPIAHREEDHASGDPAGSVPGPRTPHVLETLRCRQSELAAHLQYGQLSRRDRCRWMLAERLLAKPLLSARPSLFISCHYQGRQLQAASAMAMSMGFLVVTGENLFAFSTMAEGLVQKIRGCACFLGIWTATGAQSCGTECWPSSWLLWELGVASAFGSNWRLLISTGISKSAWQRLDASRQHVLFDETSFEAQLRVALNALWRPATVGPSSAMQSHYSEI